MKSKIFKWLIVRYYLIPLLLTAALFTACEMNGNEEEGTFRLPVEAEAGTVTGTVLDAKGKPIAGAKVRIENDFYYYDLTTNSQGNYTSPSLPLGGFKAVAWATIPYQGQNYTLRMAMPQQSDYDYFDAKKGAVRNFEWKISGPIPDREGAYFGGTVELMNGTGSIFDDRMNPGDRVLVTLNPKGPLMDGSTGRIIERTITIKSGNDTYLLQDIPTGQYEINAIRITPEGDQERVLIGTFSQQWEAALFTFQPGSYGVGTYENGLARMPLYLNLIR